MREWCLGKARVGEPGHDIDSMEGARNFLENLAAKVEAESADDADSDAPTLAELVDDTMLLIHHNFSKEEFADPTGLWRLDLKPLPKHIHEAERNLTAQERRVIVSAIHDRFTTLDKIAPFPLSETPAEVDIRKRRAWQSGRSVFRRVMEFNPPRDRESDLRLYVQELQQWLSNERENDLQKSRKGRNSKKSAVGGQKRTVKSFVKGEAREKIITTLTAHHKYENGYIPDDGFDPIKNNELADIAKVGTGSVSNFWKAEFGEGGAEGDHKAYVRACQQRWKLINVLKRLNEPQSNDLPLRDDFSTFGDGADDDFGDDE